MADLNDYLKGRDPLRDSVCLKKTINGQSEPDIFEIDFSSENNGVLFAYENFIDYTAFRCKIGKDGSVKKTKGVLKEFYPAGKFDLKREEPGLESGSFALVSSESEKQSFIEARNNYVKVFKSFEKLRNPKDGADKSFAKTEMLFGINEDEPENSTVYFWSEGNENYIPFFKYTKKIEYSRQNAANLLTSYEKFADAMRYIHERKFTLGSLNFNSLSINTENGDILINYPINVDFAEKYPDAGARDYHSFGMLIYFSLLKKDYKKENYDSIGTAAASSEYFSDDASVPYEVMSELRKILKKLLAEPDLTESSERFESDESLTEEIRKVITDYKKIKPDAPKNVSDKITEFFFENPLYKYADENGKVNVLFIGFDNYASKAADKIFELCQTPKCEADITVLSENKPECLENYLNSRPSFKDFFTVDNGKTKYDGFSLGNLNILQNPKKITAKNNPAKITEKLSDGKKYSFVIISGENNRHAADIAENIKSSDLLKDKFLISIIRTEKSRFHREGKFAELNITEKAENSEACRMLTDRIKNIGLLPELGIADPMGFACSIEYKLFSKTDNMTDSVDRNAVLFNEVLSSEENLNELIMFEHRRLLAYLSCEAWQNVKPADTLPTDTLYSNPKKKTDIRMVPSRIGNSLEKEPWVKNGRANYYLWDNPNKEAVSSLDSLDRVSVDLHLIRKKQAESIRKNHTLITKKVDDLRNFIVSDDLLYKSFVLFETSLNDMLTTSDKDVMGSINRYKLYLKHFKKDIISSEISEKEEINSRLDNLTSMALPILSAYSYVNLKSGFEKTVKDIPFIMTYDRHINLLIPFTVPTGLGKGYNELFSNTSSSIILKPENVTFLFEGNRPFSEFKDYLKYVCSVFDCHKLKTKISVIILGGNFNQYKKTNLLSSYEISDRIKQISNISDKNGNIYDQICRILDTNEHSLCRFTAAQLTDTKLGGLLIAAIISRGSVLPTFRFESTTKKFLDCDKVEKYNFASQAFDEKIELEDLYEPGNLSQHSIDPQLANDYKFFWKIYKGDSDSDPKIPYTQIWKSLCDGQADDKNNKIASVPFNTHKIAHSNYSCIMNVMTRDGLEDILDELVQSKCGLVYSYTISDYSTELINVNIDMDSIMENAMNKIVKETHALKNRTLSLIFTDTEIIITNEKAPIKEMSLYNLASSKAKEIRYEKEKLQEKYFEILSKIAEKGYITEFKFDENHDKVSFGYQSTAIRQLMSTSGRLFEIFIYYNVISDGRFDDAVTSLSIKRESGLENEFDLVLTKGFKTMIVEAKARRLLNQDFYNKLYALSANFGINSIPVLVLDKASNDYFANRTNSIQRSRGDEYGIKTIIFDEKSPDIAYSLYKIIQ